MVLLTEAALLCCKANGGQHGSPMSGIYLSYRRMESAAYAGRLYDHLIRHFGRGSVFMDIGGIARGQEFPRAIESALNACEVVLVVIGNGWGSCTRQDGRRRLDDPNDWVRLEVAAALHRNVLVVPVLVEGARLPDPACLPEELRPLCQRHACELSDLRWSFDVGELVRDLEKVVRSPRGFKVPGVKDKRLRWFVGGAIILALLLGMAFVWQTVFQKAPQVQNDTVRSSQPKVTESPVATGMIPGAGEKQAGGNGAVSTKSSEAVTKAKRVNLLASENGGHVLAASSDSWVRTINGDENGTDIGFGTGQSAVFAFKDERPATFDIFTMLIPGTHDSNVKEFELLQGNESPTGRFESIGKFQTQNVKLFNTPYQEFKFSPVTAKYLKVTILSAYAYPIPAVYQIQLFGVLQNDTKVTQSPVATGLIPSAGEKQAGGNGTVTTKSKRVNLFASENGGHVLAASSDNWVKTINGDENATGTGFCPQSAVFAFKDERPATFDMFTMLIPGTHDSNVREFELLQGNESPTGPFESIGKFQARNVKLFNTPYQEFKFSPVTAKYLKVTILSAYAYPIPTVYQIQLFGVLENDTKVTQSPVAAEAIPGAVNLLAPENGGHVLVASSDDWTGTIDGKERDKRINNGLGQTAVFAFRDERPATFDTFTMLINESWGANVKEFELLQGNQSPTGSFESVGKFQTQNMKLFNTPYQEFKFSPVTAKYLKVRILSTYDGGANPGVYQWQLFGVLQAKPPKVTVSPVAAEAIPGAVNLLAPENGGHVLVASSDAWTGTIDGKEHDKRINNGLGQTAVFTFRDERPATFDTFTMLINESWGANVKEFELLQGNQSPIGSFESVGKFQTQNVKLFNTPYQEFKFSPVTAKYMKVRILSTYDGGTNPGVYQWQLFGVLQAKPPKVMVSPVAAEAIPGAVNLLAPENGGHVLIASSDNWAATISGNEHGQSLDVGQSAVFAFKDEHPGTFDMFTMLIPGTRDSNVKEFELLQGNQRSE